jgi:hypothetical protein
MRSPVPNDRHGRRRNRNVRNKLTDGKSNLSDFQAVQRVRGDVSDMAQSAAQSGHGNKARLLRGVLRQLDQSLENASEGFLQANRNFAQASRDIEAVQAGRQAATRGRSEDVIPAYQALRPEAQAGFRSGYVDPLIAQTEGAAFGVNRPDRSRTMRLRRKPKLWLPAMV